MDIGGFGSELTIFASQTFPNGLTITEFADDADPVDSPSIQVRDKAMGLNGRLITWGKAAPILLTINIIPDTADDVNLKLLFDNNRVARGVRPVQDVIDATLIYPSQDTTGFSNGATTDYVPTNSIASSSRFKSKPYSFAFETKN
jgi:hypothetical protein